MGFALVAPFIAVPAFVIMTLWLQDLLVDGSGLWWLRAAMIAGTPTGLVLAAALAGAMITLARRTPPVGAAVLAVAVNAVGLGIILVGIMNA